MEIRERNVRGDMKTTVWRPRLIVPGDGAEQVRHRRRDGQRPRVGDRLVPEQQPGHQVVVPPRIPRVSDLDGTRSIIGSAVPLCVSPSVLWVTTDDAAE